MLTRHHLASTSSRLTGPWEAAARADSSRPPHSAATPHTATASTQRQHAPGPPRAGPSGFQALPGKAPPARPPSAPHGQELAAVKVSVPVAEAAAVGVALFLGVPKRHALVDAAPGEERAAGALVQLR